MWEREKERGQGVCSKPMYWQVWAHSSPSFTLFRIQRSQNLFLSLSVPIVQLVKAWRGVFFQAVLSSNPGQVKKISFKDNCLDSEIFIACQCWDWNGDLRDCNGESKDWNFNPCKISKNPCIIKIGLVGLGSLGGELPIVIRKKDF